MSQTNRDEEQRWLAERWFGEDTTPGPETASASAGNESDPTMRKPDQTIDVICTPTLEKLYAAQRKQKQDLAKQIEEAMTRPPK